MSGEQEGLPEGWDVATIGSLGLVGSSRRVKQSDWKPRGVPFYRAREIVKLCKYGTVADDLFISEELFAELSNRGLVPETGDIMITGVGTIGVPYEVRSTDRFYFKDASVLIFKNLHSLPSGYLAHYFRSPQWNEVIHQGSGGSTVRTLTIKQTTGISVPVAPANEQRRIVSRIESLHARSEAAKEALDAIPPLLEKFRQSVLAAAFRGDLTASWRAKNPDVEPASVLLERIRAERRTRWIADAAEKGRARAEARARKAGKPWTAADDAKVLDKERVKAAKKYKAPEPVDAEQEGLPELPEGWCWARFDEVLTDIKAGKSPKATGRPAEPGEFGVLKVSAVSWGHFDAVENKVLDGGLPEGVPTVRKGDLLISRANTVELVGAVVLVREDHPNLMLSDKTLRLDLVSFIDPTWVLYGLRTKPVRSVFEEQATGTSNSMRNLSQPKIRSVAIPLAPEGEQRQVATLLAELLDGAGKQADDVGLRMEQLSSLNQSILAKAFRGELVPQDPTDEPAIVLLERIRAEREAAEAAKKAAKTKRGRKGS